MPRTAPTRVYIRPARQIRPVRPRRPLALGDLAALGVADPSLQRDVGTAATLATAVTSAAATPSIVAVLPFLAPLGPAAPFVALGAVAASLIVSMIGGGCGSACVDASKAEQIYEAGADNLWAVYKAGMISKSQFIAGAQAFIRAGQQHEAKLASQKQAAHGANNLTSVINALIAGAQGYPDPPARALDLSTAHGLYVSGGGWYPDSLQAAAQLADAYLQSLPAAQLPAATAGGALAPPLATAAGTTVLGLPLWLLAGAALGAYLLIR